MKPTRLIVIVMALAFSLPAGINWKAVWLEPNPIPMWLGASTPYVAKGINGSDYIGDLTRSPYLKVTSSDDNIVAVDQANARLIGKAVGRVELRVSFSEATSIIKASVAPLRDSR